MSKKIFAALIVAVVATLAGYNIYQSQRAEVTMSDLARKTLNPIYISNQLVGDCVGFGEEYIESDPKTR